MTNDPELTHYTHCNDGSTYDTTRQPVGLDVFRGLYPKGSEALHIAELGCGTGNYLDALDRLYEKSDLCGVDRSKAMLNACEDKIMASKTTNRLRIVEADLLAGRVPGVANHSFHMV
jgi:ubiquinone/menaquinone biosynthesis C-methylase UbiE